MDIRIKISDEHLPAFLAYLGLGTLFAIRKGIVPVGTGIWTLVRPEVWEFLFTQPNIPKPLIDVYQTADELSGIKTLIPNEFDTEAGKLMDVPEKELAQMKDPTMKHPTWVVEWGSDPLPRPRRRLQAHKHKRSPSIKRKRNGRK